MAKTDKTSKGAPPPPPPEETVPLLAETQRRYLNYALSVITSPTILAHLR